MKTILDPSFRYTASFSTDLRKTFARIRRSQGQERLGARQVPAATLVNVASIVNRTAAGRR
jgi:hypothetical protein